MHIELPEKKYYKIGEVSKAFGVKTSTIRFWETEFTIIKPKKNEKGNRLFTAKDIDNLRIIYRLVKERGFTIEGARLHLRKNKESIYKNFNIISSLEKVKAELLKLKEQLD